MLLLALGPMTHQSHQTKVHYRYRLLCLRAKKAAITLTCAQCFLIHRVASKQVVCSCAIPSSLPKHQFSVLVCGCYRRHQVACLYPHFLVMHPAASPPESCCCWVLSSQSETFSYQAGYNQCVSALAQVLSWTKRCIIWNTVDKIFLLLVDHPGRLAWGFSIWN